MKRLALILSLVLLTGIVTADTHQDYMEQEDGYDSEFFPEEQEINLTELKDELNDEVPGVAMTFIEKAVPGQFINIEVIGEPSKEFLEEIAEQELTDEEAELIREEFENQLPANRSVGIEVDSDLEYITVGQEAFEDPTIHVEVDFTVIENSIDPENDIEEDIIEYIKGDEIEYDVSGVRNRLVFMAVDLYLRFAE